MFIITFLSLYFLLYYCQICSIKSHICLNVFGPDRAPASCKFLAFLANFKKIIDDALNPIKSDIAKLLKLEKKINAQEKLIKSLEKRVELVESLEKRVEALEPLQERVDILESQLKVLESLDRRIDEVEQ